MSGPSHRGELQPGIFVSEQIKAPNSQIFNIVQKIKEGIREDRKISFKYYDYTLEKTLTPRHGGENYIISPYATVWKNDRYYLVGYSDKREKIVSFRIDRMDPPRTVKQPRIPAPSGFSIQDYSSKKFKMYDGPEERVTLSCKKEMVNHIIDCFGKDVELQNIRDNVFDVTVPVSVSKTFYSWLMQYAGAMVIKGPENVKQEYEDTLRSALTSVDGLK
jgi:predicted DNA-binding transcriptional regulator YafY